MPVKEENNSFYVCSPIEHVGSRMRNWRGDVGAAMDGDSLESYKARRVL